MTFHQQLNSLLNEMKLLQSVPPEWRLPLIGLGVLIVVLLLSVVLIVRSELPPDVPKQPEVAVVAPAAPAKPNPVIDLFNPNEQQNADQQRRTAVIVQVDNILLSTFFLVQCHQLTTADYQDTYQLLLSYTKIQGLAHSNEEADTLVRQRANAIGGSYSLLYGHKPCTKGNTADLLDQLDAWRRAIRLAPVRQL